MYHPHIAALCLPQLLFQVTKRLHAIESLLQALELLFKPPQKALPHISVDLFGSGNPRSPNLRKTRWTDTRRLCGRPPARKHAGSTFCKAQESTKVITAVRNLSVYIVGVGFSGDRRPVVAVETIGINEELVDILLVSVMQSGTVEELPDMGVD
ncbi:hypothetical protein ASPVEDRAFT_153685 [Aspergillus versicolor CBS 583.65]|uniref:Uncharacterized protein n=1 Tax=Aspergillus versicolor CBS 583.65 TaxID=1036611 RepID=A0A1L9PVH1_ASPVE|nr:uncharacterized protein ASPVEDRAFT_153685 [Aspergillus versicolor CBS 583.65]OJJ05473.1 hypothetical protein ASPVEDRAFT_153685 [Aspergillus versicolor CBS 583.65]